MKSTLIDQALAMPYPLNQPVNRLGSLGAILALHVATAAAGTEATITVSTCDTADGTFEPVTDVCMFLSETRMQYDTTGSITQVFVAVPVESGDLVNVGIDISGCKEFIRISVAYSANGSPAAVTASYALVLGDYNVVPVRQ